MIAFGRKLGIDPDTGVLDVVGYAVVDDPDTVINRGSSVAIYGRRRAEPRRTPRAGCQSTFIPAFFTTGAILSEKLRRNADAAAGVEVSNASNPILPSLSST